MKFCELKRRALRERQRAQDRAAPAAMLAHADDLLNRALWEREEAKRRGSKHGYSRAITRVLAALDCYAASYSLFRPATPYLDAEMEKVSKSR